MEQYKYLHTKAGLTVVLRGRPYSISAERPEFKNILALVMAGEPEQDIIDVIERNAREIQRLLKRHITENIEFNEGCILYKGLPIYGAAVTRMLDMINRGHDVGALANFIEKERQNPDPVMIEHLYTFLQFGDIPLTSDGDFLVYKAVRGDYRDIHSGTFDNSVGRTCKVPRQSVDPERSRTCSYGLHVCSYAYLPHFSHADGHVMLCKVDPRDVVAIPHDYNNTKMRVCKYEVVGEVTTYYRRGEDVLGKGPALREESYEVWLEADGTGEAVLDDSYYTLDEAKARADAIAENPDFEGDVWVTERGTHVYTA